MNDKPVADEELVELVFGELDVARQSEVRTAIEEDTELAVAAQGLETAAAAVRAEAAAEISGDFNDRLRRRVRAETADTATAPRRRRFWLLAPLPLAAATSLLLAFGLFDWFRPGGQRGQSAMAWSDVVRAVNQVRFFHATVYQQRPDKLERLDFYYHHPDTWRIHALGRVTFLTPKGTGVYDVGKKAWAMRGYYKLDKLAIRSGNKCPPGEASQMEAFAAMMDKGNMLDAVLAAIPIFNGKPPAGEPVKSEQAVGGQGMEAFDYAHDANQQWVRIWVLKESRLPIQMVVYEPDQNESMLVVFDYTTAQPEDFFDLEKFDKAVTGKPRATPEEIQHEGLAPTGGKPIDSRQAFTLKGGYKAPVLVNIESADTGDLVITAEDPHNRTPQGGRVEGTYYEQLFDNWGNTYCRLPPDSPRDGKVLRQVYLAVPPFQRGEGQHTIKLRYCVWGNDEGVNMNYDKIVSEETVEVPRATGIAKSDERLLRDPLQRAHLLYHFNFGRSPLWVQLGGVDPLLAKQPEDVDLLYEKLDILRFYDLEEDRFWLFERTLKDRALAKPFDNWRLSNLLGDYLIHLFNADRRSEFDALIKQLEPLKDRFLASTGPEAREMQGSFRRYTTSLPIALSIPKALAAIEKGPRPTVEVLGRSRDGSLWLSVVRPPNRNHHSSDHSWSAPRLPKGSPWTLVSSLAVDDKVFLQAKGSGDEIQLVFDVMIMPLVVNEGEQWWDNRHIAWSMTVKVPAASVATVGELAPYRPKWLPGGAPGMSDAGTPSPLTTAWAEAGRLFDAGQYAAALKDYREMLSWPRQSNAGDGKEGKTVSDETRRSLQGRQISCLLHLDRLDEAKAAAERLEAESPKPDFANPDNVWVSMDARAARVEIIDWLIGHKRLDEAQKALDQLNRGRPDTRLLDGRHLATKVSNGVRGWQQTYENWRAWSGVDRAWWRLRQAQTGQRIPPVEP